MPDYHRLLRRQLRRHCGEGEHTDRIQPLLRAISAAYQSSDDDRAMLERAMELSSHELDVAARELRAVLEALPDEFVLLNPAGKVLLHKPGSPPVFELRTNPLGQHLAEVPGVDCADLILDAQQRVVGGEELVSFEYEGHRHDGAEPRDCDVRVFPLQGGRCIALLRNISERKVAERRIAHLAYHDALTGLPNRLRFQEELSRGVEQARATGRRMGVVFLDVDRFKYTNDTFGHAVGDELLQTLADRLRRVVGEEVGRLRSRKAGGVASVRPECADRSESFLIARMGGDEFTVILHDLDDCASAMRVCREVGEVGMQPVRLTGVDVHTSFSIGLSVFPDHGDSVEALLRNADAAMYTAKSAGRNNAQIYQPSMNEQCHDVMRLESALRRAVARGELEMVYQPIVCAQTGSPQSVEALVRWTDPTLGPVSPAEFIPVAEESDLILEIGRLVVDSVCRQIRAWLDEGFVPPKVSLNLSSRHLWRGDVVCTVDAAMQRYDIPAELLGAEMTETAMVRNTQRARESIVALRGLGLSISLDDFGTGFSSLGYLKQFPVDVLKIDGSFVRDITSDREDAALVRAIIAMGQGLGLTVVAEGVETRGQLGFLRQHGCDLIQGFLVCRPSAPDVLRDFVESVRAEQASNVLAFTG